MRKFRFYKESDGRWYIDLPEWTGSKADLEMVDGADTMLDYMLASTDGGKGGNEVIAYISETEFEGADVLALRCKAEDIGSGAYYSMQNYKGIEFGLNVWLCDVTLFVFNGKFPEKIYISVCQ